MALEVLAQRGRAVEIVRLLRGDLLGEEVHGIADALWQGEVLLLHLRKVRVALVHAGEHGGAHALARAREAAAGERVARAGGEAARGEDLGGGGEVRDDVLTGGRREALGEVERAGGIPAHGDDHRLQLEQTVAQGAVGALEVEQVAPQRGEARADEQVAALIGRVRPGAAGVGVLDRAAQQRAPGGVDLHDRLVRRGDGAAELLRAERLPARCAQGERGARVGEEQIVADGALEAPGKAGERGALLPVQRRAGQRDSQHDGRARQNPRKPHARRPAGEQEREQQRQERRRGHVRAEEGHDKQQRDQQERQREEGAPAAGQRGRHAGQQKAQQHGHGAGIRGQRQRLPAQKQDERVGDGGPAAGVARGEHGDRREQQHIGERAEPGHAVQQREHQRDPCADGEHQPPGARELHRHAQRQHASQARQQRRQRAKQQVRGRGKERFFHSLLVRRLTGSAHGAP